MRLLTETKEVEIQGTKFTIGIIPRRKWLEIEARERTAYRAYRLASVLKSLPADAKPEEISLKVTESLSPEELRSAEDDLISVHWDLIKFGVKGHSAPDIPFGKDNAGLLNDDTIEIYELNGFFTSLAQEIKLFNKAGDESKKN